MYFIQSIDYGRMDWESAGRLNSRQGPDHGGSAMPRNLGFSRRHGESITVSKGKSAVVKPVSHQDRKVSVLQWGMGWMVQNRKQSSIRQLCQ